MKVDRKPAIHITIYNLKFIIYDILHYYMMKHFNFELDSDMACVGSELTLACECSITLHFRRGKEIRKERLG